MLLTKLLIGENMPPKEGKEQELLKYEDSDSTDEGESKLESDSSDDLAGGVHLDAILEQDEAKDSSIEDQDANDKIPHQFVKLHDQVIQKLKEAIAAKNLSQFKLYMGPAFYPILAQYENDICFELELQEFARDCKETAHMVLM